MPYLLRDYRDRSTTFRISAFCPVDVFLLCFLLIAASARASAEPPTGKELFSRCEACHLQNGSGVPGSFPPLASRLGPIMKTSRGRDYLALVVQYGLVGELYIDGSRYFGAMPAQGPNLGDRGVAIVLNYIMKQLNARTLPAGWEKYSGAEVSRIEARYPNLTPTGLLKLRVDVFGSR